jgi:hypothetical protein
MKAVFYLSMLLSSVISNPSFLAKPGIYPDGFCNGQNLLITFSNTGNFVIALPFDPYSEVKSIENISNIWTYSSLAHYNIKIVTDDNVVYEFDIDLPFLFEKLEREKVFMELEKLKIVYSTNGWYINNYGPEGFTSSKQCCSKETLYYKFGIGTDPKLDSGSQKGLRQKISNTVNNKSSPIQLKKVKSASVDSILNEFKKQEKKDKKQKETNRINQTKEINEKKENATKELQETNAMINFDESNEIRQQQLIDKPRYITRRKEMEHRRSLPKKMSDRFLKDKMTVITPAESLNEGPNLNKDAELSSPKRLSTPIKITTAADILSPRRLSEVIRRKSITKKRLSEQLTPSNTKAISSPQMSSEDLIPTISTAALTPRLSIGLTQIKKGTGIPSTLMPGLNNTKTMPELSIKRISERLTPRKIKVETRQRSLDRITHKIKTIENTQMVSEGSTPITTSPSMQMISKRSNSKRTITESSTQNISEVLIPTSTIPESTKSQTEKLALARTKVIHKRRTAESNLKKLNKVSSSRQLGEGLNLSKINSQRRLSEGLNQKKFIELTSPRLPEDFNLDSIPEMKSPRQLSGLNTSMAIVQNKKVVFKK